jgi:integrase
MTCIQSFPPKNRQELRKILNSVSIVHPVIANMLEMSALTGLRYSDCSILKKSDVLINGLVRERITIVQQKGYNKRLSAGKTPAAAKKAAQLKVTFSAQAQELITDSIYLNPTATYLFESDRKVGSPYTAQYVNRILKKVAIDLKLKYPLSTHSFRKSFALMLIKGGAKIHEVRDLLGHSSLASTDHYLSTFIDNTDKIIAKIKF